VRKFLFLFIGATALSTLQAQDNFSFQGIFLTDDQVRLFDFTLASPETVTFQTWGYGGGTNALDQVIAPDGFESLLTWFEPDGSYIDNSASCGAGNSYKDACLDANGQVSLGVGTYTLALTQAGNSANCPDGFPGDLACGFSRQGNGDYTPVTTGDVGCTAFCGTFGTQENGHWAVDILNVSSASATPETATMLLAGCGLALIGLAKRRERTLFGSCPCCMSWRFCRWRRSRKNIHTFPRKICFRSRGKLII
jgi:hypothetical protein